MSLERDLSLKYCLFLRHGPFCSRLCREGRRLDQILATVLKLGSFPPKLSHPRLVILEIAKTLHSYLSHNYTSLRRRDSMSCELFYTWGSGYRDFAVVQKSLLGREKVVLHHK
jgi:hypothetical protein